MILSSHILSEIEDVCSTLLILRKGELVASGTIAEIANGVRTDAHRLRVRVSGENAEQLLAAMPSVTSVERLPEREQGWQELMVSSQEDIAQLVPAVLAAGQVKLRMLYPMDVELEDLFMKLMQEG